MLEGDVLRSSPSMIGVVEVMVFTDVVAVGMGDLEGIVVEKTPPFAGNVTVGNGVGVFVIVDRCVGTGVGSEQDSFVTL